MYRPPTFTFQSLPLVSSASAMSVGPMMRPTGGAMASAAWATANQARYVPFWLPEPFLVVKLLAYNGATAAGNTDIGVYDANGNELISIAAAAQAGTSAWQEFDVTDTWLVSGLYYIGLLNTTTTGTYFAWASKEYGRLAGVFSQAVGAGTLPTPTATFAALDTAMVPLVGMSSRTLI